VGVGHVAGQHVPIHETESGENCPSKQSLPWCARKVEVAIPAYQPWGMVSGHGQAAGSNKRHTQRQRCASLPVKVTASPLLLST